MEEQLEFAMQKLRISYKLKEKQWETLQNIWKGRDCFSILPTGYGKSIIFQLLPWFLQGNRVRPGIVIVVSPLTSIILDQVSNLASKGIKASFLNIQGTCHSFEEGEEGAVSVTKLVTTDMSAITEGNVELLYSHPEALFTRKMSSLLRSRIYQESVCCIAIDEVHMIEEWGEELRPKFKRLGEMTCLFPNAAHLSLTATATEESINILCKLLQYKDPAIIRVNPDRPNIFIEKLVRPPNINKLQKLDAIIEPLCKELKEKKQNFPVTVVYVESLESLGYFYQYVNCELKESQYIGDAIPENRIFAQFHKDYTETMKNHIISELKSENPKLRLIFATVALGMGLDARCITRIIHCRPPTTLKKYLQEIGRAGRSDQSCTATLYYNNNDIAHNRKGLSDAVVKFCKNNDTCLRLHIQKYFGFEEILFSGPADKCCSNCRDQTLT